MYYTYKVLDENGKEEIVKADSTSIGVTTDAKGNIYGVYNKTRVNGDDYITQVSKVGPANSAKEIGATSAPNAVLTYTNGALSLNNGTDYVGYTLADNAKITLVTLQSAKELNKDKAASYEVAVGLTGKALGDLLKDYELSYSYAGKLTESTSSVIEELFVTVTAATFTKTPAPVVSGTYRLSTDTTIARSAGTSTISVAGKVEEKIGNTWTNIAVTDVEVTYTVQTWNSASGDWNAAKTYTAKVASVNAGTVIGASVNLPVPTTQNVLVSAVVKTSVGTFAIGEVVK